ncbi:cation/H(+) antiporter 15-like [Panicum miliaceum]|uniref:Cation/H(+) antiporter 15-like n=1 Tax=Panicum miliaceum TaxID=4540 RepID=A0A3L6RH02_PANMI|nr:cation/H(+) antiporter 15-like [Panicum miliaceum]
MARSLPTSPQIDTAVLTRVPGVSLDMLFLVVIQALAVIYLAKFLHLFLRRYNQPSAVSQILAGVAVGGMGLRNAIVHVDVDDVEDMYGGYISAARVVYMFLVGLDLDLGALRNATRRCVALAYATVAASLLVAAITPELLAATLMLALTNTSSITVARVAGELNLTVSENGRLVVAAAIITNLICVVGDGLLSSTTLAREKSKEMYRGSPQIKKGFLALAVAGVAVWRVRPMVTRINKRNAGQHHVRGRDLVTILLTIWFISSFQQLLGFDGMPTSLALGMAFPREGPAARTVADALVPPINGIVLPFYFATIGMRLDYNSMPGAIIVPGMLLTLLGLVGKAVGAAAASSYLNIPVSEALRYSVLLNVKGHVDTMNMKFAKSEGVGTKLVWAEQALYAMIIGNLIGIVIAGPAAAAVLRREKEEYRTRHQAVESLGPEQELRMLACAHGAHAAPGILSLVELLVSAPHEQPAVPVFHFFEVPRDRSARTPYHQQTRDDEDKGGPDAVIQTNRVVDVFSRAMGVFFRQVDVVSLGATRDAAVACRGAEDAHAGLVLVPCYKEQRFDGKMACRLEERWKLNAEVLARAPCTVGLLVDRPYRHSGTIFQTLISVAPESGRTLVHPCSDRTVTHVIAAVFLGGPDDREAVSFSCRLAEHPAIGLTVFRFVKRSTYDTVTSSASRAYAAGGDELDVEFQEGDVDERFLWRFYENYASRELAMYVEKVVESPVDVVEALEGMAGMFSLVVVGRGGRQPAELMAGLERWAEDVTVSLNESLEMGSVLVMQQHTVALTPTS